jgi:hypothetical protein
MAGAMHPMIVALPPLGLICGKLPSDSIQAISAMVTKTLSEVLVGLSPQRKVLLRVGKKVPYTMLSS